MCMHMLIKRTNILFDQKTWDMLTSLAQQENNSVAELVRSAVNEVYTNKSQQMIQKNAVEELISFRKKVKGKINYRSLIENGRKY